MANRLNYNDLLKYMEIVLDMEKNIYIQDKTIEKLNKKEKSLGFSKDYSKPTEDNEPSYVWAFVLSVVLGVIVVFILNFVLAAITMIWLMNTTGLESSSSSSIPTIDLKIACIIIGVVVILGLGICHSARKDVRQSNNMKWIEYFGKLDDDKKE